MANSDHRDRADPRYCVDYQRFMAGEKIPSEDSMPEWLLNDVATLVSRGAGFPISSDSCKEAVALVVLVSEHARLQEQIFRV